MHLFSSRAPPRAVPLLTASFYVSDSLINYFWFFFSSALISTLTKCPCSFAFPLQHVSVSSDFWLDFRISPFYQFPLFCVAGRL